MLSKYFFVRPNWVRGLLAFASFALAFGVLFISVLQSASISYVFATPTPGAMVLGVKTPDIDYQLPFGGGVLPDNPLWDFKAVRDRIWYLITADPLKKAELALLFSDKRLSSSATLFVNKKPDIALSTLTKGEKYLELAVLEEQIARKKGYDTSGFLKKLALSSLKHRQIIESEILPLAPEDAKPEIVKAEDYAKEAYKSSRDGLSDKGVPSPNNPFDGD